ncbi:MAG: hypothetical protein ACUVWX_07450 [Kiritimatiellia bacterium]
MWVERLKGVRFLLLLSLLTVFLSPSAQARVFYRWKSGHQSTRALLDVGGRLAYQADVTLNGGEGRLTVISFDKPFEEILALLKQLFGTASFTSSGDSMALGTFLDERVGLRLLVISPGDTVQTLVLKLEQSPKEFQASMRRPSRHMLAAVPECPGGEPLFFCTDHNTGTSLAVARVSNESETVRRLYEAELLRSGWKKVLAGSDKSNPLSLAFSHGPAASIFLRGQEVCCVYLESTGSDVESRITILHRKRLK